MTRKMLEQIDAMGRVAALRTESVALVLDEVRASGKSAHPQRGEMYGAAVLSVCDKWGYYPRPLQEAVERYADASDALTALTNN